MSWQETVQEFAEGIGARKTSGFRTPAQQRALGSSSTSYHLRGTPEAPGALDLGGTADQLKQLFDKIKEAFKGRINELYLNLPGGESEAIRHNRPLGSNPEAGRAQHLHVAIGDTRQTYTGQPKMYTGQALNEKLVPAYGIDPANRGSKALEATGECGSRLCPPDFKGYITQAFGGTPEPQENCICWSDVWVYGVGIVMLLAGSWMLYRGKE